MIGPPDRAARALLYRSKDSLRHSCTTVDTPPGDTWSTEHYNMYFDKFVEAATALVSSKIDPLRNGLHTHEPRFTGSIGIVDHIMGYGPQYAEKRFQELRRETVEAYIRAGYYMRERDRSLQLPEQHKKLKPYLHPSLTAIYTVKHKNFLESMDRVQLLASRLFSSTMSPSVPAPSATMTGTGSQDSSQGSKTKKRKAVDLDDPAHLEVSSNPPSPVCDCYKH